MQGKKIAVIAVMLVSLAILAAFAVSSLLDSGRMALPVFNPPETTATTDIPVSTEDPDAKKAAEEAARLELEKHIMENTIYLGVGTRIFKDREMSEEVLITENKIGVYSLGREDGFYHVKLKYEDAEPLGYVTEGSVYLTPVDFIELPESDCDYGFYRTVRNYEKNPQVKVKGIYLSESTVTGENFDRLIELVEKTDLNSMVVDIKDDSEELLFLSDSAEKYNPEANRYARLSKAEASALLKKAKDRGIYLIARIVTFKSPIYSAQHSDGVITHAQTGEPFTEDGVLLWTSPMDKKLWEYNVGLAEEAAELGFQEIQFDYVRFPTVPMGEDFYYKDLGEHSKTYAVQSFLKFAYERLKDKQVYLAADVFGWAATAKDDVQIGQHWEAMTNVVDYICPMIYPSHYGEWNFGIQYPDTAPYETVKAGARDCIDRNANVLSPAKIRPWIQHFTASYIYYQGLQYIEYGREEIQAQIQALRDLGIEEYLLWSPTNDYEYEVLR